MDGETLPRAHRAEPAAAPGRMQRAEGRARIGFRRDGPHVRLTEFVQQGCCKIRLPRPEPGMPPDAVLLNTAGGQVAIASLVLVAPGAEERLGTVRERLETCIGEVGASALRGLLSLRFLAPSGQALRRDLESVILALRGRPMPRVWSC